MSQVLCYWNNWFEVWRVSTFEIRNKQSLYTDDRVANNEKYSRNVAEKLRIWVIEILLSNQVFLYLIL